MKGTNTLNQKVIEMSTVSAKGQITLPKWIRDNLELIKGDKIIFDIESLNEGAVNLTLRKNTIEKKRRNLDELLMGINNADAAQIMSDSYIEISDVGDEIVF